jgi:hypothetical protein
MTRLQASLLTSMTCLMVAANAGTIYTSDPNLANLTSGITNYATFLNALVSDSPLPFTPSAASLAQGLRVVGNNTSPPIVARFPAPVSQIRVFPNIDHFGTSFDGYQYSISGSNDGSSYTPLFNPLSLVGGPDPFMLGLFGLTPTSVEPFTLATFSGTPPTRVNNVLSPGAGTDGQVGYVADFTFDHAYQYYSFTSSTPVLSGNEDQELSAVASLTPAPPPAHMPEPSTYVMIGIGMGFIGLRLVRRRP